MGEEHGLSDAVGINRVIPARAGLLHKAETMDIVCHDHRAVSTARIQAYSIFLYTVEMAAGAPATQ